MSSAHAQPAPSAPATAHTLDALAACSLAELDALYRAARAPASLRALDGPLVGRMLAVRGLPGLVAGPLRRWAASRAFVWDGKTFAATTDEHGGGYNRVTIPGVLGSQNLFPFGTARRPSALDGAPAVILDYDIGVNPGYIRRVHDEVRELAPGLFFGPAMWKRGDARTLLLWFALDARLS